MARFRVLQFCATAPGMPDWNVGDIVDLPDGTVADYLEPVDDDPAPPKRAKSRAERAVMPDAAETATTD